MKNPTPKLNTTALQETEADINDACNLVRDLLVQKNREYGDSALNPIRIFSRQSAVEGIKVRLDDKLSRLRNDSGIFKEDTVLDLLGYLILLRVAQKRGL